MSSYLSEHLPPRATIGKQAISPPAVANSNARGTAPQSGSAQYTYTWDWNNLNPFGAETSTTLYDYDGRTYYTIEEAIIGDNVTPNEHGDLGEPDDPKHPSIDSDDIARNVGPPDFYLEYPILGGIAIPGLPGSTEGAWSADIPDTMGLTFITPTLNDPLGSRLLIPEGWIYWVSLEWNLLLFGGQYLTPNPSFVDGTYDTGYQQFILTNAWPANWYFQMISGMTQFPDGGGTVQSIGFYGTWAYNPITITGMLSKVRDGWAGYAGGLTEAFRTTGFLDPGSLIAIGIATRPSFDRITNPEEPYPVFVPKSVTVKIHGLLLPQADRDAISGVEGFTGYLDTFDWVNQNHP